MLLRNKVLMNKGGSGCDTVRLVLSLKHEAYSKAGLENIWNSLITDYVNPTERPVGITESLAPFYYFKNSNKLPGGAYKPVVSIDIGGGTTDIVVFKSNKPLLLTSFKFAANTIFGDGFSEFGTTCLTGLVKKYFSHFEDLLRANNLYNLSKELATIKEKNRPRISTPSSFQLKIQPEDQGCRAFSYNSTLSNDDDIKIIFLYFYSAIAYHIAQLMKSKKINFPKHLVLSGTGSN